MEFAEIDELKQYTGAQLKSWLRALGKKTTGNKSELVLRLMEIPVQLRGEFVPTPKKSYHDEDDETAADGDSIIDESEENYEDSIAYLQKDDEKLEDMSKHEKKKTSAQENEMTDGKQTDESKINIDEWKLMKRELNIMKRELQLQKRENELLQKENELMKRANSKQKDSADAEMDEKKMHFSMIKDLVPEFTGTGDNFEHWEMQFRNVLKVSKLDDSSIRALISNKLKGRALRWFHSRADMMSVPIDDLLADMGALFKDRTSKLMMKRNFEERKWSYNETFQEYFHEKVILANKITIEEDELLEYLIEGIPDQVMRSQAKMHCFRNKEHLLEAFKRVNLAKRAPPSREHADAQPSTSKQSFRCYNCNALGHVAANCKKPKRQPGACHVCGEMGHYAADCTKRKESRIYHVDNEADQDDNEL